MKKFNAMLIAGSLLAVSAVTAPALARDYCNDFNNNNHHSSWNWRNRSNNNTSYYVNRYARNNPYWNTYGNGMYNSYSNGYYNPNPGFFTRVINRIF